MKRPATRSPKESRPNPVITWDTARPSQTARGLMVDDLTGVTVVRRGRCRLSSCDRPAAEEVAPLVELCAEHAEQFLRYHEEGRPPLRASTEVPSWWPM